MNAAQLNFQLAGGAQSQNALILEYLKLHAGEEVAMPKLYEVSGSFAIHSRISDLRKAGHNITNRTDNSTRPHRSYYTYHA